MESGNLEIFDSFRASSPIFGIVLLTLILPSKGYSKEPTLLTDEALESITDQALKLANEESIKFRQSRAEFGKGKHTYVKFTKTTEEIANESNRNLRAFKTLLDLDIPRKRACKILRKRRSNFCQKPKLECDSQAKYRTINGTCNNLVNVYWGSSFMEFKRLLPHTYEDGYNEPRGGRVFPHLPNPRLVSSTVHTDLVKPDLSITNMFPQVGQFLDHDLTLAPEGDKRCCKLNNEIDCWPIKISRDDPFYSKTKKPQYCMDFTRSSAYCFPTKSCVREQMNMLTSYMDGSQIYGSDDQRASHLREYAGGRLRVNKENPLFLPTVKEVEEDVGEEIEFMGKFLGGDERVNEMPALTVLHTLWVREHNRIADQMVTIRQGWGWDDDRIYEETKRIVISGWQNIIYTEFLPLLLGNDTMEEYKLTLDGDFTQYHPFMDATIFHSFSTAAFRIGHTFVNGLIQLMKGLEKVGSYRIRDNFFDDTQISQGNGSGYELILGGLMMQNAQTYDSFVTEDLSNFLLKEKGNDFGADLIARNLQRGRDHGLRPYDAYRGLCKLPPLTTWKEKPDNILQETWFRLQRVYNTPSDIDLFTGGLSEIAKPGALSGPTFNCLLAMQFEKIKFGDRFFYTHGMQPGSFTKEQIEMLHQVKLGDIICQNSNMEATPRNVFHGVSESNPWIMCDDTKKRSYINLEDFFASSSRKNM